MTYPSHRWRFQHSAESFSVSPSGGAETFGAVLSSVELSRAKGCGAGSSQQTFSVAVRKL